MNHRGALGWVILTLVVVLVYPAGVRANGPIPENFPALAEIKAETSAMTTVSVGMMACGGMLALAGALMVGDDDGEVRGAGVAITAGGFMLGFGGYSLFTLSRHLEDWIP